MIPISGVYEVAIRVRDLGASEAFYRGILGFEFALRDEKRSWIFLRAGGSAGMVVLQEDTGQWPSQHVAFGLRASELEPATALLKEKGIKVIGPIFHSWMPGRSLYFNDPDGHALELFAPATEDLS